MTFSSSKVLSVSQITTSIKDLLEGTFRFVAVKGEISNLKTPYSGHSYFTLKDADAQMRAVFFKGQKRFFDFNYNDGDEVVCHGRVTLYEPRGEYQLVVDSIEKAGSGSLQLEFEKIKAELKDLGYFDLDRKKPLPYFPQKIVVISSATGAALQDFLKVARRRNSPCHILIRPVQVQGKLAAGQIAEAIRATNRENNKENPIDAIVICRGGGSIEDLWAFNERVVADAIFHSTIPVVSGVGHEVDFTIADFCADLRSATPTAAAEQLLPDGDALTDTIELMVHRQRRALLSTLFQLEQCLNHAKKGLLSISDDIESHGLRVELATSYFQQAMERYLSIQDKRIDKALTRLQLQAPSTKIAVQSERARALRGRIQLAMVNILEQQGARLSKEAALLHSVSPLATLSRGYSVVRIGEGKKKRVITDVMQVACGDQIEVLLHRGKLSCEVQSTEN